MSRAARSTPSTRCARLSTSSNGRPTSPNPTTTLTESAPGRAALAVCTAPQLLNNVRERLLAGLLPRPGNGHRLGAGGAPLCGDRHHTRTKRTHVWQQHFETKPLDRDLHCPRQAKTIQDPLEASDIVPITPDCGPHPHATVAQ